MPESVIILAVAILIDRVGGEPPNYFHPVAWMGSVIRLAHHATATVNRFVLFSWGLGIVAGGVGVAILVGILIARGCEHLPWGVSIAVQVIALKFTFSFRRLTEIGLAVANLIDQEDLIAARRQVSFHLVSRDTSLLSCSQVSAATIASLSENTSDSVIAPLFYFAVGGLPLALAYRYVNTCDAMLGYRTAELEWLGKASARMDDLLNWVPARITAMAMLCCGGLARENVSIWWSECRNTPSPNAGHPMSAAAAVLSVELDKVGVYQIGHGLSGPDSLSIRRSIQLISRSVGLFSMLVCSIQMAVNHVAAANP